MANWNEVLNQPAGSDPGLPGSSAVRLLETLPLRERWRNATDTWKRLRLIAAAAVTCAVLVALAVAFIDRPVATWVHAHLGDARFHWFKAHFSGELLPVGPFSVMASPAQVIGEVAPSGVAILAVAALAGWRASKRGRMILALSVAVVAGKEINQLFKWICGRTWPESWLGTNPSWIRDGVYGFFPFHTGGGWGSFPSGHTTIVTTTATLLWVIWPELRAVWVAMVVVVIAGLIGANYHFVSDIIGGLFLGTAVGLGINALMLSPNERLNWSVLRKTARDTRADERQ